MDWMTGILGAGVILYFLAIMPRMTSRPDRTPLLGWYYAHRGFHDLEEGAPENSLKAFQRAVDKGYGIELDVQMSRDGIPVVFHDFTLKRVCGREGKVADYTCRELAGMSLCGAGEGIPTLEEVLGLVGGRVPLIVELKIERTDLSVCRAASELLEKYEGAYCVESFNPLGVFWYRRKHPEVVRGQLSDNFAAETGDRSILMQCLRHLLFNWLTKPDFIAYHWKYTGAVSRSICCRIYGAMGAAWTVRSKEQKEELEKEYELLIFENFEP